jgi:hypothetical protein
MSTYRTFAKNRAPEGSGGSGSDSRLARDEEEAIHVAKHEKLRAKIGRREQRIQATRKKITLPEVNFLKDR